METLKKLVNDSALNVRQVAQMHLDTLSKINGQNNDRESEEDGGSIVNKINEITQIADKVSDAIDCGKVDLDRNEHSVGNQVR